MSSLPSKIRQGVRYLSSGALLAGLFFIGLVCYPGPHIPFPEQDYEVLLLRNITVIDVRGERVLHGQHVRIKGGRIAAISSASLATTAGPGEKLKIIDGTGRFLLPAFWDMHVHLTKRSPQIAYPAFIRHGITHVRDMRGAANARDPFAGYQPELEKWNKAVNDHTLLGPRLHGYASFAIDGPHTRYQGLPSFYNCATPADARKLVAYLAGQNITLIKVYNNLPRQAFFTLVQEAKKAGIAVAGHKPVRVSTVEASQAGMKSLEHARFLLWDSFPGADSLRRQQDPMRLDNTQLRQRMLAEHDTALLQAMFRVLRHNATWYTPTHLTRKADAFAGDQEFRARYKDVNPIMRFLAFEDLDATLQEDTTALARQVYRDFYVKGLEISGQASRQGIKLLAGSDVPELPGSSLHEELVELARAGLPPMEVLRTATLYPAQYYGLDSLYGSIERGKRADLVLLSANPLQDIRHTVAIQGVIMDGRYVDQHSLATLASVVNKRSASWDMQAKLLWDIMVYMTL